MTLPQEGLTYETGESRERTLNVQNPDLQCPFSLPTTIEQAQFSGKNKKHISLCSSSCALQYGFTNSTANILFLTVFLYLIYHIQNSKAKEGGISTTTKPSICIYTCEKVKVTQSCPTLCNPMDCNLPNSSVHGILQTRILERVPMSFSRESSQPKDRTQVSCIAGRFFTNRATREAWCITYVYV